MKSYISILPKSLALHASKNESLLEQITLDQKLEGACTIL